MLQAALERIDAELYAEMATDFIRRASAPVEAGGRIRSLKGHSCRRANGALRTGRSVGYGGVRFGLAGLGRRVGKAGGDQVAPQRAILEFQGGRAIPGEARAAGQLHHPGIVAVHDVGRTEEGLFIVSELVNGENLAERLRRGRPSFRESAELTAHAADALDYAHRQGVVHRDVKPSNIMLGRDETLAGQGSPGRPMLTDFGLALDAADEAAMTLDGQVLGTPAYMSPEQIRTPHMVDGRSDIYSMGVIFYELLTGELPFRGPARSLMARTASEPPRPPRRLNDRVPRDLETICLKCLAKEPSRRYPTAGALAVDLRRWLAGEPIFARPVGPRSELGSG